MNSKYGLHCLIVVFFVAKKNRSQEERGGGKKKGKKPHYLVKGTKLETNSNLINLIWETPTGFSNFWIQFLNLVINISNHTDSK